MGQLGSDEVLSRRHEVCSDPSSTQQLPEIWSSELLKFSQPIDWFQLIQGN